MRWYSQRVFDLFDRACEKQQVPYSMDYLQDSRYVAILREPDPAMLRRSLKALLTRGAAADGRRHPRQETTGGKRQL